MKHQILLRSIVACLPMLGGCVATAGEISGTISSTLNITEDSWLTGDVTCRVEGGPCIRVAASNITLWMLGFTMTGKADPPSGCAGAGQTPGGANAEHGIDIVGQRRVEVFGPGVVQRFRGMGINLGSTRVSLKGLTVSSNCWSGIFLGSRASDNDLEENVAVRNGSNSRFNCGGICLFNSNNNRLLKNVTSGNGYAVMNVVNFGIALSGTSRGNIILKNQAVGNVNGLYLEPNAAQNLIQDNNISGNPPNEVSRSAEGFLGFDIRNFAAEGANIFHNNLCATYSGAGPRSCPSVVSGFISLLTRGLQPDNPAATELLRRR